MQGGRDVIGRNFFLSERGCLNEIFCFNNTEMLRLHRLHTIYLTFINRTALSPYWKTKKKPTLKAACRFINQHRKELLDFIPWAGRQIVQVGFAENSTTYTSFLGWLPKQTTTTKKGRSMKLAGGKCCIPEVSCKSYSWGGRKCWDGWTPCEVCLKQQQGRFRLDTGKASPWQWCSGIGRGCLAGWWGPHPWRCSRKAWMWHLRTFGECGGVGLMVGLNLRLFQPQWFCDEKWKLPAAGTTHWWGKNHGNWNLNV